MTGHVVTPYDAAQYANHEGGYVSRFGTVWTLMSEGDAHFGVIGEEPECKMASLRSTIPTVQNGAISFGIIKHSNHRWIICGYFKNYRI